MNHFLSTDGLAAEYLNRLLWRARDFAAGAESEALRSRSVGLLFFEPSTRTRLSFEQATRRLGGETLNLDIENSSIVKGESLEDTVATMVALGANLLVVRHSETGMPHQIAAMADAGVINAGDGTNQHPTQAILDLLTMYERFGRIEGLKVTIVGDVAHSRVARSNAFALAALGAAVRVVCPPELAPDVTTDWPALEVTHDLDQALSETEVAYLLRVQTERGGADGFPSTDWYHERYGLTTARLAEMKPDAVVMHPGPMNRGVEIDDAVADSERCLAVQQVRNGVPARMAILEALIRGAG